MLYSHCAQCMWVKQLWSWWGSYNTYYAHKDSYIERHTPKTTRIDAKNDGPTGKKCIFGLKYAVVLGIYSFNFSGGVTIPFQPPKPLGWQSTPIKNGMFVKQPAKNGGWTSKVQCFPTIKTDNIFQKKSPTEPLRGTWAHAIVAMLIGWLKLGEGRWCMFVLEDVNFVGKNEQTWCKLRFFLWFVMSLFALQFLRGESVASSCFCI